MWSPPSSPASSPSPPPTAQAAVELVDTTPVAARAARILDESPSQPDELLDDVTAVSESEGGIGQAPQLFSITARSDTAQRAADVANAFAAAVGEVRTRQGVDAIDQTIQSLRSRPEPEKRVAARRLAQDLEQLEALRASQSATTQVLERAAPPKGAASPRPLRNAALALVLAVLLAGALHRCSIDWTARSTSWTSSGS
jgi:capsular polysaccharide biosynthesis protein